MWYVAPLESVENGMANRYRLMVPTPVRLQSLSLLGRTSTMQSLPILGSRCSGLPTSLSQPQANSGQAKHMSISSG
jgi:hypothetical protein